jgi:protein-disulfide isomerase
MRLPSFALVLACLVGAQLLPAARAADLGEPAIGDPAAPVTIIEYSSMTCPHCASFHANILPELKARYIDSGKVRLVLRDFPLDKNALSAAVLAHCAGPERHPQFTEVFFAQQSNWARSEDPVQALKQLAQLGGLSQAAADACLADKELETAILKAQLEGQEKYDIRSTPSFIIDGKTYAGGQSIETFAEIIDPLLPQ